MKKTRKHKKEALRDPTRTLWTTPANPDLDLSAGEEDDVPSGKDKRTLEERLKPFEARLTAETLKIPTG